MTHLKTLIAVAVTFLAVGIIAGSKWNKPVEVQKEVETQTRIVTRRVVSPDGTRTVEQVRETVSREETQTKTTARPDWIVGVNTNVGLRGVGNTFQVQVHRRILGPVLISAAVNTKAEMTVGVAVEF